MDAQALEDNMKISLLLLRRPDLSNLLLMLAQPALTASAKTSRILVRQVLINQGVDPNDLPQEQPVINIYDHLSLEEHQMVARVSAEASVPYVTFPPYVQIPTTSGIPLEPMQPIITGPDVASEPVVEKKASPKYKGVTTPSGFEMGRLPITTYFPTHFFKGTGIQVNSTVKKVEELSSDDFIKCATDLTDSSLTASIVESIFLARGTSTVTLLVGDTKQRTSMQVQLEHPFFVLGKGWCSCLPKKTAECYGLECENLQEGDICIVLTQDDDAGGELVTVANAERNLYQASRLTKIRQDLRVDAIDGRATEPLPETIFEDVDDDRCVSEPLV